MSFPNKVSQVVAAERMGSLEAENKTLRGAEEEEDSTSTKKRGKFYDIYGPEVYFRIFISVFNACVIHFILIFIQRKILLSMFLFRFWTLSLDFCFWLKCGFNDDEVPVALGWDTWFWSCSLS